MPASAARAKSYPVLRTAAWSSAFSLVCALLLPQLAHACPMCFNGNGQNQDAFLYGSLLLMFVPTIALGSLGYWAYRRIMATEQASAPLPPSGDGGAAGDGARVEGGPVVLRVVERR